VEFLKSIDTVGRKYNISRRNANKLVC